MRTMNYLKALVLLAGILSLTACCTTNTPQPRAAAVVPTTHAYYFDLNKSNVKPQYTSSLRAQAQYLAQNKNTQVRVVGNTDSRGASPYNYNLGMQRANAVASKLEQYGVAKDRIHVVSNGENDPVASGTSASSYQQNRRVDVVYTN